MTIKAGDIVTLDHHGKRRMGIVLEIGPLPGVAIVAIGYGVQRSHEYGVRICPNSRDGKILHIYKDTSFYSSRTFAVALESIYPTGRKCPRSLLRKLEPFIGESIRNSYNRSSKPEKREDKTFSTGQFSVTLGDLIEST